MSDYRFKVGDQVKVNYPHSSGHGLVGTICDMHDGITPGVEFPSKPDWWAHDCNGHCKDGYGWYYNRSKLELESTTIPYDPTQGNEPDDV